MSLTTFRTSLKPLLQTDLRNSGFVSNQIVVVDGYLDGPVEKRDQAALWSTGIRETGRVMDEQLFLTLRVFVAFKQQRAPESPIDPSALEGIAETIQSTIKGHQTGLGPWFQRGVDFTIDPRKQMVEAHIVASQLNQGV